MYVKTPGCQISNLIKIYYDRFGYIQDGYLVEVGAFNCYNWSNSHCLLEAGWSGLMVEPQEKELNKCKELYKGRDNIIFEQCCVGARNSTANLYLGGSNTTIKRRMVSTYNDIEWAKFSGLSADKVIECEIRTLNYLLRKHKWPTGFEVLIIDVEGAEMDTLRGFSIKRYQPALVIIETHELNEDKRLAKKAAAINHYFNQHGYQKIYADHINSIYLR